MKIRALDIIESISSGSIHSSIILTYSFDRLFYETVILKALRLAGSGNNLVLADHSSYAETISRYAEEPTVAGRNYHVIPIFGKYCFHPKILFLAGEETIRILVGSGNATIGGYSLNRELFLDYEFNIGDNAGRPFIQSVWRFLSSVINQPIGAFVWKQLSKIEDEVTWLADSPISEVYDDGEVASRLLIHTKDITIFGQLLHELRDLRVKELIVFSPFFDENCHALRRLMKEIKPKQTTIVIELDTVNLNSKVFETLDGVTAFDAKSSDQHSYLHAKAYLFKTNRGSFLLTGSANCTNSGLGTGNAHAYNTEACILLENKDPNYFDESLRLGYYLDTNRSISKKGLHGAHFSRLESVHSDAGVRLEMLEYHSGSFRATVSENSKSHSYVLCLSSTSPSIEWTSKKGAQKNGVIEFDGKNLDVDGFTYGRLRRSDGLTSNKLILCFPAEISKHGVSRNASRINRILEHIREDGGNWFEIIDSLEPLLLTRSTHNISRSSRAEKNGSQTIQEDESKVISYEEFLQKTRGRRYLRSDTTQLSHGTELGTIIECLQVLFGISRQEQNISKPFEQRIDSSIYEEEVLEEDDGEVTEPKTDETKAEDESEENVQKRSTLYYRRRIQRLATTYSQYVDSLIRRRVENDDESIRVCSPVELAKFWLCAALVNRFAGKVYDEDFGEVLSLDFDEEKSYPDLLMSILWNSFCYEDSEKKHFSILKNTRFTREKVLPLELRSAMVMACYCISSLLAIDLRFRSGYRRTLLFMASKIYLDTRCHELVDGQTIKEEFARYFDHSGLKEYKDPVTKVSKFKLGEILHQHDDMVSCFKSLTAAVELAKRRYGTMKGSLPSVATEDLVWLDRTKLSFVSFADRDIFRVYDFGKDDSALIGFKQGYASAIDFCFPMEVYPTNPHRQR